MGVVGYLQTLEMDAAEEAYSDGDYAGSDTDSVFLITTYWLSIYATLKLIILDVIEIHNV